MNIIASCMNDQPIVYVILMAVAVLSIFGAWFYENYL